MDTTSTAGPLNYLVFIAIILSAVGVFMTVRGVRWHQKGRMWAGIALAIFAWAAIVLLIQVGGPSGYPVAMIADIVVALAAFSRSAVLPKKKSKRQSEE